MSQREQPPRFFLDRSLGRKAVSEALRADSWDVITLAEHYGMPADEQVTDTDWIEEAAKHGWPILMKDKRIRHRQAEINRRDRAQGSLLCHHQRRSPFGVGGCELERPAVGDGGLVAAPEPPEQVSTSGWQQVLAGRGAGVLDLLDEHEPGSRSVGHGYCNGSVERDDREGNHLG